MEMIACRAPSIRRIDVLSLLLVIGSGCLIYGWIAFHTVVVMGFTDALDYLLLADYFRGLFTGTPSIEATAFYQTTRYPPLYPAFLGLFGGGTDTQPLAMAVSSALAVVSAIAVWLWARIEYSTGSATVVAMALLLYPAYFLFNLHTISEPLSIAIVFTALTVASLGMRRPSWLPIAALLVGLSPLARAANLPLVLAFVCWILHRQAGGAGRILLLSAISIGPSAVWFWHRHGIGAESYTSSLNPQFMLSGMGGWPEALWLQPWQLFVALVNNWGEPGSATSLAVGLVLLALAVTGGVRRLMAARLDAWFAIASVAALLVWPYPAEFPRLVLPLYPLVVAYAIEATTTYSSRLAARPHERVRAVVITALATAIVGAQAGTTARILHRVLLPVPEELAADKPRREFLTAAEDATALTMAERYARLRAAVASTKAMLPDGACVYAADARFLRIWQDLDARSYPRGLEATEASRKNLVDCDYFFLSSFGMTAIQMPPLYPAETLSGWTRPLFVSSQHINDAPTIAAALLVRTSTHDVKSD